MSMRPKTEDTAPWYRQFWPWFVIAIPLSSVIGGIAMFVVAQREPAAMVVDDYRKIGVAIHRKLERDQRAVELGLSGALTLTGEPPHVRVTLTTERQAEWPAQLRLSIAHPTLADRDLRILLERTGETWNGRLANAPDGRRYVQIEPPSGEWRLAGELPAGQMRLNLHAADRTGD